MRTISNTDDVIDSRDVIARIEELTSEREGWINDAEDGEDRSDSEWADEFPDEAEELATLEKLAEEAEGYAADWKYGEQLIRDSYFTDYIEELINDCYEMPKEMNSGEWPWRHMSVDYEAAAEEAKSDYTAVDFGGVTYWIR